MSSDDIQALADCYRIIEETGSIEQALLLHPELERELQEHVVLTTQLSDVASGAPDPLPYAAGRRLLLSALAASPTFRSPRMPSNFLFKLAGGLAGFVLMGGAALGAAAAGDNIPGPVNDALSKVGLHSQQSGDVQGNGKRDADDATPIASPTSITAPILNVAVTTTPTPTHGDSVSDAVHDAIASSTPGAGRGEAVSQAACLAAHDRSTLPEGAQNAPGQQDRTPTPCTHGEGEGIQALQTPAATPASEADHGNPGQGRPASSGQGEAGAAPGHSGQGGPGNSTPGNPGFPVTANPGRGNSGPSSPGGSKH